MRAVGSRFYVYTGYLTGKYLVEVGVRCEKCGKHATTAGSSIDVRGWYVLKDDNSVDQHQDMRRFCPECGEHLEIYHSSNTQQESESRRWRRRLSGEERNSRGHKPSELPQKYISP